jgi:NADPH-dependent 2,4-dienoyl-CoA reductase/sulfur reductase-like enzyme
MSTFNRRDFLKLSAAGASLGGLTLAGCASTPQPPKTIGRVVVIGGGYGGATAAKYLRMWSGGTVEVVLIDRNTQFVSCPISNLVLGGNRRMEDITHGYQGLREHGVQVLHDDVADIDSDKRVVKFRTKFPDMSYDRLIVSPGVDFMFDQVQGLDAEAQKTVLHAWKAGPETLALRRQLEAMRDGGVYLLSIPRAPYRCPPGPYERMSQIAHYFKQAKPRSKVIVLDANEDVTSKGPLFKAAWKDLYGGIIEYRPNAEVKSVDAKGKAFKTDFDTVKGDVLNIVPPMRAGDIARSAGLINANNRWCGVDWTSMESTAKKNIHVLGDATLSAPGMPKSGHMANQHGKVAAAAIIELLNGRAPSPTPMMANTCYSFVSDKEVIHVASVHRFDAAQKTMVVVPGSAGVSASRSELEGQYAASWALNIWRDMLG